MFSLTHINWPLIFFTTDTRLIKHKESRDYKGQQIEETSKEKEFTGERKWQDQLREARVRWKNGLAQRNDLVQCNIYLSAPLLKIPINPFCFWSTSPFTPHKMTSLRHYPFYHVSSPPHNEPCHRYHHHLSSRACLPGVIYSSVPVLQCRLN